MSRRYPPQVSTPNDNPYIVAKQKCQVACGIYNQVAEHISILERSRLLKNIFQPISRIAVVEVAPSTTPDREMVDLDRVDTCMLTIQPPLHVEYGTNVQIGRSTVIERNCTIFDSPVVPVCVGARCRIGPNTAIYTNMLLSQTRRLTLGLEKEQTVAAVTIEDDCWIGGGVTICAGVHIGRGSTIEDGSVVTRDIAPGQHVSGNPAAPELQRIPELDTTNTNPTEKYSRPSVGVIQSLQFFTAAFKCLTSFMKYKAEKG